MQTSIPMMAPGGRRFLRAAASMALAAFLPFLASSALAAETGTIEGRVLNVSNGDYLNAARVSVEGSTAETLTDRFGQYRLTGVPAGEVKLKVGYTGLNTESRVVSVGAGVTSQQDFELRAASSTPIRGEQVIQLDAFTVAAGREMSGAGIAINEQRFKPNVSTVVSADEFGDNTDGNPGEFMKFLPGVTADTNGSGEPRVISLAGSPVAATPVTIDGFRLANSSGLDRQTVFDQVTLNNMSRIEVDKSQTPDHAADAIGGSINMVSKSAFEHRRAELVTRAYVTTRDGSGSFSKTPGPGQGPSVKPRAGYDFTYIKPVNAKFGFTLTGVHNSKWGPQNFEGMNWAPNGASASSGFAAPVENPYMNRFNPMIGGGFTTRDSIGATIDFRLTKYDVFSFAFNLAKFQLTFNNRTLNYIVGAVDSAASYGPSFTHGSVGKGSVSTQGGQSWAFQDQFATTYMPTITYRHNGSVWQLEAGASYSHSLKHVRDIDKGFYNNHVIDLQGLTLNYDGIGRSTVTSITATDASGAPVDLTNLNNYTIRNVQSNQSDIASVYRSANASAKRQVNFGPVAATLKVGFDVRQDMRDQTPYGLGSWTANFVGADGIADGSAGTGAQSPDDKAGILLDPTFAGQTVFGAPKFQWPSTYKLYQLIKANPSYATQTAAQAVTTVQNNVNNSKHLSETISSGYARLDFHFMDNRLWIVTGARYERTTDEGEGKKRDQTLMFQKDSSGKLVLDGAGKPIKLTDDLVQQAKLTYLERGQKSERTYSGIYPSINASFNVSSNLIARAAIGKTLFRPNYSNIIPGMELPDPSSSSKTITDNNPDLKPWTSINYNLALEYYFNNSAGLITIGGFRRNIRDFFVSNTHVITDTEMAERGIDPTVYAGYNLSTTINGSDAKVTGVEYSYKQALTMLPHWARGLTVFHNGTIQRLTGGASGPGTDLGNSTPFTNYVPQTYSTGVSFGRDRITLKADWTYRARERQTLMNNAVRSFNYNAPKHVVDVTGDFRLTKQFSLFGSARNLAHQREDLERYTDGTPGYARTSNRADFKPLYTLGVKGTF
jgi:iron complex outermembrane receptor protein